MCTKVKEFRVGEGDTNTRLDRYLRRLFTKSIPQSLIESAVRKKHIKLCNGKQKLSSATRVEFDQRLCIADSFLHSLESITKNKDDIDKKFTVVSKKLQDIIKKSIIYEDENIVAINKPFGIPVQSGSGIKESIDFAIKSIYKDAHVVHRLDKHTTGVLIFAKNLVAESFSG